MHKVNSSLESALHQAFGDSLPLVSEDLLFKILANLEGYEITEQLRVVAALLLMTCTGQDKIGLVEYRLIECVAAAAQFDSAWGRPRGTARMDGRRFTSITLAMRPDQRQVVQQWLSWMLESAIQREDEDAMEALQATQVWMTTIEGHPGSPP